MLNGQLFNIINSGVLVGFFEISVSRFDDCHNSVMGVVVVVVSKNYLLNDHTRTNILISTTTHTSQYKVEGGSRGGISFFISYISLCACARVQLNTFHILSINNANTCGGIVGPVDTHSPILPADLHYTSSIYLIYTY